MDEKINLSIIIPHYNSPDSLEKLILTIPEKEDIQIIVVDDNSTKYLEELEKVREKYANRVLFRKNTTGIQSAGACRNTGIDLAEGKWILFADADDYFLPDMYRLVSGYFASDYDMVIFSPVSVNLESGQPSDRHKKHEERIRAYLDNPTRENYLALDRTTTIWSKLIRRSVMTEHEIYCRTSLHGNDFVCSQMLFYYCENKKVTADQIYCITKGTSSLTAAKTTRSFWCSVEERTEGFRFNREHYSKKDLRLIDLAGLETLVNGKKMHLSGKELLRGCRYFKKNGVYILPRRLFKWKNLRDYLKKGYLN